MGKILKINADAKINLGLDVLGRRDDGYHDVRMIMQTLDYGDTVTLEKKPGHGFTLECDDPALTDADNNLAIKAAKQFEKEFNSRFSDEFKGWDFGMHIRIRKRIPVSAGLGGGSADAAAVIKGMNALFETGLGKEALMNIGAAVGSDVPFCITGRTALAEGRGEKLTPVPDFPKSYVLVVKPDIIISTGEAYDSLDSAGLLEHPDIDALEKSIAEKQELSVITGLMGNTFEKPAIERYPVIGEIKKTLEESGALKAMMSGSGPSVFAIFDDEDKLLEAKDLAEAKFKDAYCFDTVTH